MLVKGVISLAEKKKGILTNSEQDKAIMELTAELKITNNELKHTNDNLKRAFECYEKTQAEVDEIRDRIIPPMKNELSSHAVWIKILSTAVLGAIGAYVATLFGK